MLKITITFDIPTEEYNGYNGIIDDILNDLDEVGASNIDVMEEEV